MTTHVWVPRLRDFELESRTGTLDWSPSPEHPLQNVKIVTEKEPTSENKSAKKVTDNSQF